MTTSTGLVMLRPRLNWTDLDWATYLDCPIYEIPVYKHRLSENLRMKIKFLEANRKYEFQVFQLVVGSKGRRVERYVWADCFNQSFDKSQVICNANNHISELKLKPSVAIKFGVPQRAVQMMLIHEK